jgi:hypothetical protein
MGRNCAGNLWSFKDPLTGRTRSIGRHGAGRPILGTVFAKGHDNQSARLRTRNFNGVEPKLNASRILRSR